MENFIRFCVAAIAACVFSLSALAQTTAPAPPAQPGTPHLRDCSKAPHPARCEARQKAFLACEGKAPGAERQACLKANLPAGEDNKS
jgi:hypothetical protein